MTLSASITHLSPSRLFLICWICRIAGCQLRVWRAKPRRVMKDAP